LFGFLVTFSCLFNILACPTYPKEIIFAYEHSCFLEMVNRLQCMSQFFFILIRCFLIKKNNNRYFFSANRDNRWKMLLFECCFKQLGLLLLDFLTTGVVLFLL